jgi:release factor glutamine methyltransferase
MATIGEINKTFKNKLGNSYPENEIRVFVKILLEHYAGLSKTDMVLKAADNLDLDVIMQMEQALDRLEKNEPVQYIIGETEFYGLRLKVNPSVLIPRPETEELVHRIIGNHKKDGRIRILDIGTGSGCIPLALKKNLPDAEVFAIDISEKALKTAQMNAELNHLDVSFSNLDILKEKTNNSLGEFDIIVSNPPYVRQKEKELMHKNVLENEPHLALFVDDDDALVFYRAIIRFAKKHLKKQACLYFEINEAYGKEVTGLLKGCNYGDIKLAKDINGKYRIIYGLKQ